MLPLFQARPLLSDALETGEFESFVDPKLGKNYIDSEMFCMIEVAAACVRHSASKRPRMGQVNIQNKQKNLNSRVYQQANVQTTDIVFFLISFHRLLELSKV
jgi:hypothetical protein